MVLLSSLDPVAFPGGELDSLIVAVLDAQSVLRAVDAVRPRKKTEVVEVAPDAPEVTAEVAPESAPDAPVDAVPDAV